MKKPDASRDVGIRPIEKAALAALKRQCGWWRRAWADFVEGSRDLPKAIGSSHREALLELGFELGPNFIRRGRFDRLSSAWLRRHYFELPEHRRVIPRAFVEKRGGKIKRCPTCGHEVEAKK